MASDVLVQGKARWWSLQRVRWKISPLQHRIWLARKLKVQRVQAPGASLAVFSDV